MDPAEVGQNPADTQLKLNAICTALLTQTPRHRKALESAQDRLDPAVDNPPSTALEQLDQHRLLVLQGDPGSGKSTFSNFAAFCLVGELLGDGHVELRALTAALRGDDGNPSEKAQPWLCNFGVNVPRIRVVFRGKTGR